MVEDVTPVAVGESAEARGQELDDLGHLLRALGFQVRKRSKNEFTLRAYVNGFGSYPLLNPRLENEELVVTVLSRSLSEAFEGALLRFGADESCRYVRLETTRSGYRYHGNFVLPRTSDGIAGFTAALERVLDFLRRQS